MMQHHPKPGTPCSYEICCGSSITTHHHTVQGFATATPGLVIHSAGQNPCLQHPDPDEWSITHLRSGACVVMLHGAEQAQYVAAELGMLPCDWTGSGKTLQSYRAVVQEVIDRFNTGHRTYTQATEEYLNR